VVGDATGISVPNRNDDKGSEITFAKPVQVGNLSLIGYIDKYNDPGSAGKFLYWGFRIHGNINDVMKDLKPLIKDANRLKASEGDYARSEVRIANSPWVPVPAPTSTAPGLRRTEHVLFVEQEKDGSSVTVLCSLQGGVTPELLAETRPDIPAKDYPSALRADLFETTEPSAQAMSSVRKAVSGKDIWKPKFTRLRYTTESPAKGGGKSHTTSYDLSVQPGGLLHVRENYGLFTVERLMLADLVQLKSRMNGGTDGRVSVTSKLSLALPAALTAGAEFDVSEEFEDSPASAGDKIRQRRFRCDIQDKFDAKRVHPDLPGSATGLVCADFPQGAKQFMAFIDDLGVVISLNNEGELLGSMRSPIVDLKLE
jgi:hypothetical protein